MDCGLPIKIYAFTDSCLLWIKGSSYQLQGRTPVFYRLQHFYTLTHLHQPIKNWDITVMYFFYFFIFFYIFYCQLTSKFFYFLYHINNFFLLFKQKNSLQYKFFFTFLYKFFLFYITSSLFTNFKTNNPTILFYYVL
jgi:hypothetical protein